MSVERVEPGVEVVPRRRTIVTALPLRADARHRLAELLDARVVDIRESADLPDLVLTPPCSPQLVGALGERFPGARVVIVELDDWEYGIELPGPVKRVLRSGVAAYVLADSLDELAAKIAAPHPDARTDVRSQGDAEPVAPHELTARATVDDLVAAFLRESVEYSVGHRDERD